MMRPSPLALLLLPAVLACDAKEKPAADVVPVVSQAVPTASTGAMRSAGKQHLAGNNFTLDVAASDCRAGAECTMTMKLVAAGEFHVNKEYPYRFVAAPAPGVTFLGKESPTSFTKGSGDYVEQGEKSGTMSVRFKPAAAGETHVMGTYKLSVCSADQCQIEQQAVDLPVVVM